MPNGSHFYTRAAQEFESLREGKLRGSNSSAFWLQQLLIKRQGEVYENIAFYIWLFLCIRRPWDIGKWRPWKSCEKLSLNRNWFRKDDAFAKKVNDVLTKIEKIKKPSEQLRSQPLPDFPDPRTLTKYYNLPELETVLIWIVYGPELTVKMFSQTKKVIKQSISQTDRIIKNLRNNKFVESPFLYGRSDLAKALKLRDYIIKHGNVLKSALYKEFRYSKAYCDKLLGIIQESDYIRENYKGSIQIKKFPQNRVFISYIGS